ncbi:MAG TPA: hypothetical protein VFF68_04710 [Anaerolineaceae bacterium]|nr:hypothetical protein [Anaerolineaceae bacterium]
MTSERSAQTAVWGLLAMMVFIAVASGLVDVYRLYAARNWAYSVAQEAALAGTSKGRDWASISSSEEMRLVGTTAKAEAEKLVAAEMAARGITGYTMDVRVLPDPTGGSISGYPPRPVRLGSSRGSWSSDEPAVGVYLEVPVNWFLLNRLGIVPKDVHVFAAAGVAD